jgi:hypothetical protein
MAVSTSISQQDAAPREDGSRPDAERLYAQLANLAVAAIASHSWRPWLEFVRVFLNAKAVALLPMEDAPGLPVGVVTIRGVSANDIVALLPGFDRNKTNVQRSPDPASDSFTVGIPVKSPDRPGYWFVLQLPVAQPRDLQALVVLAQALSGYVVFGEERRTTSALDAVLEKTSGLLELFKRAESDLDFGAACRGALDAISEYLGGATVSAGFKCRGRVRLAGISGVARIDPRIPEHHARETAMGEAVASGRRLDCTANSRTTGMAAHETLIERTGAAQVTALPIAAGRGAVLVEWPAPPVGDAARLLDATAPFIPALFDLLYRARPNPLLYAGRRLWGTLTRNRRMALAGGLAAAVLAAFLPIPWRIGADCRVLPEKKRVLAAPFDAQLKTSKARPGDAVRAGDVLAELDHRDLKLKEAELAAARERALRQRNRLMSNEGEGADFASAQVADFEVRAVSEELELVRRKLSMLTIKAPIDGVIVEGDLRRAEGQPVAQGKRLYEVAPLDRMILEIGVPDRDISRVRPDLRIKARLDALPSARIESAIDRVHPQSEQRSGKNLFLCEAPATLRGGAGDTLRPGMSGRVAIAADPMPLAWVLGHRFWEWIVTTLFW